MLSSITTASKISALEGAVSAMAMQTSVMPKTLMTLTGTFLKVSVLCKSVWIVVLRMKDTGVSCVLSWARNCANNCCLWLCPENESETGPAKVAKIKHFVRVFFSQISSLVWFPCPQLCHPHGNRVLELEGAQSRYCCWTWRFLIKAEGWFLNLFREVSCFPCGFLRTGAIL